MPQEVIRMVHVTDVRKGDLVVDGDDTRHEVEAKESKIKWTVVHYVDGTKVRRLNTESVTVARQELTEEEKHARERAYSVRRLTSQLEIVEKNTVPDAVRELLDKHEAHKYAAGMDVFDWANLPGILRLQAERKPWLRVRRTLQNLHEHHPELDADVVTAFAQVLREEDRRRFPKDPLSRSTSVLGNLFEDLDVWAWDHFRDTLRYSVSDELLADEQRKLEEHFANVHP